MINTLKITLATLLLTILFTSNVFASMKISPNRFEFTTKPGQKFLTGSFSIEGDEGENIRFKIYPEMFDVSDKSKMMEGNKDNKNSLVNKIRFSPSEFTIAPGTQQIVRFTLTDLNLLPDGESRVALFLEDTKTKEVILESKNKNIRPKIVIKTRTAVPIYVDNGKIVKSGELENLSLVPKENGLDYLLSIKSIGNSKIRLNGIAQIVNEGNLISEYKLDEIVAQAGKTVNINNTIPIDKLSNNKNYKFKLIMSYKDDHSVKKHLVKELDFNLNDKKAN